MSGKRNLSNDAPSSALRKHAAALVRARDPSADPWSFPSRQRALPLPVERQLFLDLRPTQDARPDFIETEALRIALRMLASPTLWPRGAICLLGPKGSGKSQILASRFAASRRLLAQDFADGALGDEWIRPKAALVFEDADLALSTRPEPARAALETSLFHLLNLVAERNAELILSARRAPSCWPVEMPDLRTRLAAMPLARIEAPSDADLCAVLRQGFHRRGVEIDGRVIRYLTRHMERSFDTAARIIDQIDRAARERRARITPRLVASVLHWR